MKIELPSLMTAVQNAIENPTVVESSYTNSYVFIDHASTNFTGEPLKVPVKITEGTSARVKTVFFSGSTKPENTVYRNSDDER
ncbi:hypothetical protein [Neorhizobium sp. P12A]|uniref:hypothetical protein n=1 Tax=Neorhizobium sp. P12A TaxID=2268027 RepID=UPI0011EEE797|nr:hypothetical protein [Neorhizobium sp. P12A]